LQCEQFAGRIHLMVTDVVMPRMSGRQLADRLEVQRPDMNVLFVSGYTEDAIVRHGVLNAGLEFLSKPITPDTLARKVREVLDTPRS
ncbi:MAG TPA: response regulator, partial [Kofleriaceae bacterium]|nr:response regulator [Kofleriaceae bacterium]